MLGTKSFALLCLLTICTAQNVPIIGQWILMSFPFFLQFKSEIPDLNDGVWGARMFFEPYCFYHPTCVGLTRILKDYPRRPVEEHTLENIRIAVDYTTYHVAGYLTFIPEAVMRDYMINNEGLDPDDQSRNASTPVGIGNLVADYIIELIQRDGLNIDGSVTRKYNRLRHEDYTGFEVSFDRYLYASHGVLNPNVWYPVIQEDNGHGYFKMQKMVCPQNDHAVLYAIPSLDLFEATPPAPYQGTGQWTQYVKNANEVLQLSAELATNETRRVMVEFFDDKERAFGANDYFYLQGTFGQLGEFETIKTAFEHTFGIQNLWRDALAVLWKEKKRHDYIRPQHAIEYLYYDTNVVAYGGPQVGAVTMKGREFKPYAPSDSHPEHPSASTCLCEVFAQFHRRMFGHDIYNRTYVFPAGSSVHEPGVTPSQDVVVHFHTFTDFAHYCGESRIWAGVHFRTSVDASRVMCPSIGDYAYEQWQRHLNGTAEPWAFVVQPLDY